MTKFLSIVTLIFLCLFFESCLFMPPSAPRSHNYKNISNSNIKLSVTSTQFSKRFIISGVNTSDSLLIKSSKINNSEKFFYHKGFFDDLDSSRLYYLKIGNHKFYKNLLKDTLTIKIFESKSNNVFSIHKFIPLKDNYIRN